MKYCKRCCLRRTLHMLKGMDKAMQKTNFESKNGQWKMQDYTSISVPIFYINAK